MFSLFELISPGQVGMSLGSTIILAFYFFLTWDAQRADSPNRGDGQIGLKVALYAFLLVAVAIGSFGLSRLLHYVLSGADTGTDRLKSGMAALLTGGLALLMVSKGLLPRTNDAQFPKAARLAYGTLAALAGVSAIGAVFALLYDCLVWQSWVDVAGALSDTLVLALVTTISLLRFGRMSGWVSPQPPSGAYPSYPPGYGGTPPGSYPPPQGGYPPGYPPAGYPPPGGGYSPPR